MFNHPTTGNKSIPVLGIVIAFLLAGCGGATPNPVPVPTDPTRTPYSTRTPRPARTPTVEAILTATPLPTLSVDESALRGTTIDFWHIHGFLLPAMEGGDTLQALLDEFNRTNTWGISVRSVTFNDYEEIFKTIQSSIYGDLPDLVLGYNYQAASLYRSGQLLADLSPYLSDPRFGLSQGDMEDFFPPFWGQGREGSAMLGLPFYRSAQVLLYNQSWARELGYEAVPATPEEFKDQACAAAKEVGTQEGSPGGAGGLAIDTSAPALAGWIYAFGGSLDRQDGSGYTFSEPGTADAFGFLRELYDDGCAWLPGSQHPNQEFASRQALFISGSVAGLHHTQSAMEAAGSSDRWTVIPFPSEVDDPVIVAYGPSLNVLKGEPEQELASWLLARWLTSAEVQARWVQVQGTLPTRASALEELGNFRDEHPQWAEAVDLMPYIRLEPGRPSWSLVHFVLSDAGRYLFSPLVGARQVPEILETLEETAAELDGQFR